MKIPSFGYKKFSVVQKQIIRGTFWMFFGVFITKIFDLSSLFVVARILSVEDFGKLSIIKNSIQTFVIFSTGSLGFTATKYIAKLLVKEKDKCISVLSHLRLIIPLLGFLLSTLIFIYSELIALRIFNEASLETAVKLMSVAFFFSALNAFQKGILAGFEEFKVISLISIASGCLNAFLMILATYYFGLDGAFIIIALNSFLLWLVSIYYTMRAINNRGLKFKLGHKTYFKKIVYSFTIPSFLSGLLVTPTTWFCNILLIGIADGYVQMALYTAAFNLALVTITINSVVGKVLYPLVMKNYKENNIFIDKFNVIFPFLLGVIINTPLILFPEIIGFAYGEDYISNKSYITLLLILNFTIIIAFKEGIARNFAAANLMWYSLLSNLTWATVAILVMYLVKDYGSIGRALSFFSAYLLSNLIFVPFYINKGLIPRNLLSKNILLILLLIIFANLFFYFEITSLYIRAIGLILLLGGYYYSFKKWIFKT